MELRHLRYFVAVAEEGSLTVAAKRRLHTAQPSLSRQIKDLEYEVGAQLLTRGPRGVELTAAGRAFLDHARLALAESEAAVAAARRVEPSKPSFALGFLTGQEMNWLPRAMTILNDELPTIEVTVTSQYSPQLAEGLVRGRLDLAFLRPEPQMPDLEYRVVAKETLVVVLPSDHRLSSRQAIAIRNIAQETFIGMSKTAPTLQVIIDDYVRRSGVDLRAAHLVDNLGMAISLVASTRGVTLLPAYAQSFFARVADQPSAGRRPARRSISSSATTRPTRPTILRAFLARAGELSSHRPGQARAGSRMPHVGGQRSPVPVPRSVRPPGRRPAPSEC